MVWTAHYLTFFTAEDAESCREGYLVQKTSARLGALCGEHSPGTRKNVRN
jgi:hypothetical protein